METRGEGGTVYALYRPCFECGSLTALPLLCSVCEKHFDEVGKLQDELAAAHVATRILGMATARLCEAVKDHVFSGASIPANLIAALAEANTTLGLIGNEPAPDTEKDAGC